MTDITKTLNSNTCGLPLPAKWDWVQEELSHYLLQKTYKDLGSNKAFVLRRIGTLAGNIYKMFINSTEPEDLQKYLECHEAGHIIFGHNSGETTKDLINKMKIRAAWPKVQDKFKSQKAWESKFDSLIYNIVMDMEVNSKMFTKTEWDPFSESIGGGIWPEDFGFKPGLDYNTYLNLVLQNPKKFLDDLQNEMNNSQNSQEDSQENGNSQSDDSDSCQDNSQNSQEDAQESNKGSSSSGSSKDNSQESKSSTSASSSDSTFSDEQLKTFEDYLDQNSEEKNNELAEKLEEVQEQAFSDEKSNDKRPTNDEKAERNLSGLLPEENISELEKNLTKLLTKSAAINKRDTLYNYNRNKHNSNVLIPKISKSEKTIPACMYILLDVSGSISISSIIAFCQAFKNVSKKLAKKSRIILWNTHLVSDNLAKENVVPLAGGGTEMAKGIDYIKSHYGLLHKEDYFIMVSDFQDNLSEWNNSLKDLKCHKLGYLFDYSSSEEDRTFDDYVENLIKDEGLVSLKDLWKHTKAVDL